MSKSDISNGKFKKPIDIPSEERMDEIYTKLVEDRLKLQEIVAHAIKKNQARYKRSYDKK